MLSKNYIASFVIPLLVLLSLIFIYWGNNILQIPDNKYTYTFGNITKRRVDVINMTSVEKQAMGINIYVNKLKYRLEASFEFHIRGNKYESTFYNNGNTSDYLTKETLKKYWNLFPKGKRIKVYYNKYNFLDCGINLLHIKKRNSKIYYLFSLISISTLLYLLFFSDFFINE